MDIDQVFDVLEFESTARAAMDEAAYNYVAGGAGLETTLRESQAAFSRYRFRPRVLRGIAQIDTTTKILGTDVSLPLGLAPVALQRLAHPEGEIATAAAAAGANVLMCAATESSCTLEEIAEVASGPRWFQLYVHKDRSIPRDLIRRAEQAGYAALVLTVDLPIPGYRDREYKAGLIVPESARPGNFPAVLEHEMHQRIQEQYEAPLSWEDIDWLRGLCDLPIVLKGILTGADAKLAVEHGVDAVWVSNHGGRQLDRAPASIDVLEEVVAASSGACDVYLDSGVRRGEDVLTALALGADAVFIGRPYVWGLAAAGTEGVARVIEILRQQFENCMTQLGVGSVSDVARENIRT